MAEADSKGGVKVAKSCCRSHITRDKVESYKWCIRGIYTPGLELLGS